MNNIFNYNLSTQDTIPYWDPYTKIFTDINEFTKEYNTRTLFIVGPPNQYNMRYMWNFRIVINNNEISFTSLEETSNKYDSCIRIFIKNKIGKINYLSQCDEYSGNKIVEWGIIIIKNLGCNKCILQDISEKKCENRNFTNYTPLSLIHKLWRDQTYYEKYGFIPIQKNNNNYKKDRSNELNNLVNKLRVISWDEIFISDKKWDKFLSQYKDIYKQSPFLAFQEFRPNKCGEFYDILYLLENASKSGEIIRKIKNLISQSNWTLFL